jgi:eukaryotic-like serine/threonine-protein kinase
MNEQPTPPDNYSSCAPTVDMPPRNSASDEPGDESSGTKAGQMPVAVVRDDEIGMTKETLSLLWRRLWLATVVLFIAFSIFLVRHFFFADFSEPGSVSLFGLHVVVVLVLGALAIPLCREECSFNLRTLQFLEWVVFGLPVVVLMALQYQMTLTCCRETGFFDISGGYWLALVFTYALFIPNTARRAMVMIGLIVLAPIGMIAAMYLIHPEIAAVLNTSPMALEKLSGFVLLMILSGVAGVLGVDSIGSLRKEAYEARQLGRYRLKEKIGAGGMGEVYLAEHYLLKRPCVIKLIRPDRAGDEGVLKRFQREVQATAKLTHWNTVEIFDYGRTDEGTFYYVMEYLPGMSLAELVQQHGPLPPERVIHLLVQTCSALREAHGVGLIHRDIKPGNIFAARRGGIYDVVKLLDFGLVKPIMEDQPLDLTTEGTVTGSPLFMSPEQATGDSSTDARTDIYALGAVAYYLVTGRPPFIADKTIKIIIAHANEPVVPPSKHRPDVPADLERVILRCLEKSPADRFQDVGQVSKALSECEAAGRWSAGRSAQWWEDRTVNGDDGPRASQS